MIIVAVVLLIGVLVVYLIILQNTRPPDASKRKWTDPKFHD
jgi:hypothetical protein